MGKDKQIIEVVESYIKSKNRISALMINGDWGSGKTFFVRNKLFPYAEESFKKKCIYVSLNGVSNTDNISKDIFLQTFPLKGRKMSKEFKSIKSYGIEVGKIIFDKLSISDKSVDYSKLINLKDCILVFDDLERSRMELKELFGYINKFVEHESIPTIIIANEKEISLDLLMENQEMKYFLTTLDSFYFPQSDSKTNHNRNSDNVVKLNPNEVKKRISYLFGLENEYLHIKEKLISTTIRYKPDLLEIYEQILCNYEFTDEEKSILLVSRDSIIKRFQNKNHNNLRTLQFVYANFLKICKELRSFDFENDEKDVILTSILVYLAMISIEYKRGGDTIPWPREGDYGQISISGESWAFDHVLGFSFVNELVNNAYLDSKKLLYGIRKYIKDQRDSGLLKTDPLKSISNWWYMEDEEVDSLIDGIINKLVKDEYKYSTYKSILSYFIILKDIGFDINIEKAFNLMLNNMKNLDTVDIQSYDSFGVMVDENNQKKLKEYLDLLNDNLSDRQIDVFKNEINEFLGPLEDWSIKFETYVDEHKNDFLNRKKFFSLIDLSDFHDALKKANGEEITNMRRAIDSVYNFSNLKEYFVNDKSNIEKAINTIKNILESCKMEIGLIKNNHLNSFIKQLEEYLVNLS